MDSTRKNSIIYRGKMFFFSFNFSKLFHNNYRVDDVWEKNQRKKKICVVALKRNRARGLLFSFSAISRPDDDATRDAFTKPLEIYLNHEQSQRLFLSRMRNDDDFGG